MSAARQDEVRPPVGLASPAQALGRELTGTPKAAGWSCGLAISWPAGLRAPWLISQKEPEGRIGAVRLRATVTAPR